MSRARRFGISLAVGICIWIIIEVVYPRAFPATPPAAKIFWRLFFVILSIIVAEFIQALYRIDQQVHAISGALRIFVDSEIDQAFKDINQSYYGEFRKTDERIAGWVKNEVTSLRDELVSGYISMFPRSARDEMAEMYRRAERWVVVTNVGDLMNLKRLPEDSSLEDIHYHLYVLIRIGTALAEAQ